MKSWIITLAAGCAAVTLFVASLPSEPVVAKSHKGAKNCVSKAGLGTGSTDENARFQAWEAVLQATNWGSWATWMSSSQRIGEAPGYSVSNFKQRCTAGGGLGRECTLQAKLCQ